MFCKSSFLQSTKDNYYKQISLGWEKSRVNFSVLQVKPDTLRKIKTVKAFILSFFQINSLFIGALDLFKLGKLS